MKIIEYEKRVNQENEEKNNIVDFLNTTIQSGENALILINEEKEDTLEFEIMGKQKKEKKFNLENRGIENGKYTNSKINWNLIDDIIDKEKDKTNDYFNQIEIL